MATATSAPEAVVQGRSSRAGLLDSFPLVHRELSRLGRLRHTYLMRLVVIGVVFVFLGFIWLFLERSVGVNSSTEFDAMGRILGGIAFTLQWAIVFFAGPTLAGNLVISEKDQGSLGLLILADRGGWDIVTSKVVSAFVQVESLLLTTLPLMALSAFFGGSSVSVMVQRTLMFTAAAACISAVTIFWSTVSTQANTATSMAFVTMLSWLVLAYGAVAAVIGIIDQDLFTAFASSEFASFLMQMNVIWALVMVGSPGSSIFFWVPSVVALMLVGIFFFVAAKYFLPGQASALAVAPPKRRRRGASGNQDYRREREAIAKLNPIAELVAAAGGRSSKSFRATLGRTMSVVAYTLIISIPFYGWVFFLVGLVRDTTQTISGTRMNRALEDIALTPATDKEIARSLMLSHLERLSIYSGAILLSIAGYLYFWPQALLYMWYFLPMVPVMMLCTAALGCLVGIRAKPGARASNIASIRILGLFIVINIGLPALCVYVFGFARWGPQLAAADFFKSLTQFETQLLSGALYTAPTIIIYFFLGRYFYRRVVRHVRTTVAEDLGAARASFFSTFLWGSGERT